MHRQFRYLLPLCFVLFLLMLPTVTAQEADPPPPGESEPFPLHRFTLPNGLRVWCQPRADSASVTALLVVGVGARQEDATNNGISHYVEHMLFTGTERWNEEEVKSIISRRGGNWNGWTSLEQTTYFAEVASQDIALALDWLNQVVFRATFPENKIDKEREVVFQEKWGRYGWMINTLDSFGFGYELERDVRRAIFPGSSLGLRVIGEDASLERLDRATLLDFYQQHYLPNNAVLIVVGNVTPEATLELARQQFGDLEPGNATPAVDPLPLPATGPQDVVVRGPMLTNQTQVMVGTRTVARNHPDRWALELLAELLERDLMEEIRYQRGLVYGLGAANVFFADTGYFAITTTSDGADAATILRTIEQHLERVQRGDIDADRFAEAQAALQGRWALTMEANYTRARWLAGWSSVLSDDEALPNYPAAIGAVTPDDLARIVQIYFTPQRRYLGMHQPIVTVTSGAWVFGGMVGLGVGAWLARRMWRRSRGGQVRQGVGQRVVEPGAG